MGALFAHLEGGDATDALSPRLVPTIVVTAVLAPRIARITSAVVGGGLHTLATGLALVHLALFDRLS